jgi:hypothetical protein
LRAKGELQDQIQLGAQATTAAVAVAAMLQTAFCGMICAGFRYDHQCDHMKPDQLLASLELSWNEPGGPCRLQIRAAAR